MLRPKPRRVKAPRARAPTRGSTRARAAPAGGAGGRGAGPGGARWRPPGSCAMLRAPAPLGGWFAPQRMTDLRPPELEVLAESNRLLTSTLDLTEVLDRLADIARTRLDTEVARIWLTREADDTQRLAAPK